jgi:competence protein ComEA
VNEAIPDWRTFASRATAPDESDLPAAQPGVPPRAGRPWTLMGLVAGGAAALGAGIAMAVALLLGGPDAVGPEASGPRQPPDAFAELGSAWEQPSGALEGSASPIVVDVAGGVAEPGLRRLRTGDRVGDAIAAAGGFAPRADLVATSSALNLAEPLNDGMKVFVPVLGMAGAGASSTDGDGLIDVNSADQALLESLPGVGPVTAMKIMDTRAERRFGSVDELRSRGVLGNAVFEGLRDMVRAG